MPPYREFDRSKLILKDLGERTHDLSVEDFLRPGDPLPPFAHPTIPVLAGRIREARKAGASVILMMGAHVIRAGVAPFLIRLMEEGLVTHCALNGAGAIHDFEFAMIGKTCESVARYVSEGQFGLWKQTGRINDAVNCGAAEGLGMGEALGREIAEGGFPHAGTSLLAAGYRLRVPVTVHVGIGNDIVHEHPNFDGAAAGAASYRDFLIFTESVTRLEGGVFLNLGSAVTGPEVYLKAISMARNVAAQEGRSIRRFTTAVFDVQDIDDAQTGSTPPKTDPRYYFRPWKTILTRTVADGGQSFYVRGFHRDTVPALAAACLEGSR
jgi:hypothetical protein